MATGVIGQLTYAARHCLSKFLHLAPPDISPEVTNLLHELNFSNRDVNNLYAIFQEMREHDPITVGTLQNEVCVTSLQMLVRDDREWIPKILTQLIELGGYMTICTWEGFLYVMLQFCTLSKLELCQVLFFIIAKETKSWSLHTLTNTQLEEFYEEWEDCPIKSFCTAHIGFDRLPKTRYSMVDFIELVTRYGALINPMMHLQRSVQQSVPNLRFWGDYDRVKVANRFIPLDFFRFRKNGNLQAMIYETDLRDMAIELQRAKMTLGEQNLKALQEEEGLIHRSYNEEAIVAQYPPLPGSKQPPNRVWRVQQERVPDWMEKANMDNKDPKTGTALGSAVPPTPREKREQPQVAKLIVSIYRAHALPIPAHMFATCEIESRPATRFRTGSQWGSSPVWDETHDIYGYIVDDTKRLEFCIWEQTLVVKLHLPQHKFYPNGFEGSLQYPGGKLDIKVEVTLPKNVSDAKDMVLSTFGEEARIARQKAELKHLMWRLKFFDDKKLDISRVQELDFISRSRVGEPKRKNMALIMERCRPEELIDRPVVEQLGHLRH